MESWKEQSLPNINSANTLVYPCQANGGLVNIEIELKKLGTKFVFFYKDATHFLFLSYSKIILTWFM
jgi:hypothetical protein